mmetsp:Transcript_18209/g.28533  ORF Transcript_18209/g.28533 Transcript_18209/m.28533 type:complete len:268 (-) Transcript_18209:511-1314(-)
MKLNIRRITGETHVIEYHDRPGATISNLKDQVAANINMDRNSIKVCYRGKNLDDTMKITDAHLQDDCTIIVVGQISEPTQRICTKRSLTERESCMPSEEITTACRRKSEDSACNERKEKEAQLAEMGFLNSEVKQALQKFEYDLEKAVEYLLNQSQGDSNSEDQDGEETSAGELSEEAEEKFNEILSDAFDFFQKVREIPKFEEARQHVVEKSISPRDFADSICKLHPEYTQLFAQHWDLWTEVVQHGIPDAESIVVSEYPSDDKPE